MSWLGLPFPAAELLEILRQNGAKSLYARCLIAPPIATTAAFPTPDDPGMVPKVRNLLRRRALVRDAYHLLETLEVLPRVLVPTLEIVLRGV